MVSELKNRILFAGLLGTTLLYGSYVAQADIVDGRYSVNQVFDVQRSPAFPSAGGAFALSNFQGPLRDNFSPYSIGSGYIRFFYTGDNNNLVGIRLYDTGDALIETISPSGDIYGLEDAGFFYASNIGDIGTFVSNKEGFSNGDSITYVTSNAGVVSLADLQAYAATTTPLADGEVAQASVGGSDTLTSSTITQKNNPSLNAARVLDSFISGSSDAAVKTAFDNLTSDQQRSNAVSQTLPVATGGTTMAILNSIGSVNQIVQARTNSLTGLSSGDGFIVEKNMWFKPFYSMADQDNENGVIGYETDSYGMVVGYDGVVANNLRLGVAASYGNTQLDDNNNLQSVDVDSYEAMLYGSYSLTTMTELNFIAGGGYHKNNSRRSIGFGGLASVAEADYDSWSANVGTGIGHVINLRGNVQFIPSARIDYNYIRNEGYTEQGAGALNLSPEEQSTEQLIPHVSGKIRYSHTNRLSLDAKAGVGYDVLSEKSSVTASYVGGGAAFRTEGIETSPWRIQSGVGVEYRYSETINLNIDYDREDRGSDFTNQSVSAKIKIEF